MNALRGGGRWLGCGALAVLAAACAPKPEYASAGTPTGMSYATARKRVQDGLEKWEHKGLVKDFERHATLHEVEYRFTPTGPEGDTALADWGLSPLYATLKPLDRGKDSILAVGSWGSRFSPAAHEDPAATAWKAKVAGLIVTPPVKPKAPAGRGRKLATRNNAGRRK